MQTIAVTRELSAEIGNCELTFLPRSNIDFGRAQQQHQDYQSALSSLGCETVSIPAPSGLAAGSCVAAAGSGRRCRGIGTVQVTQGD